MTTCICDKTHTQLLGLGLGLGLALIFLYFIGCFNLFSWRFCKEKYEK